MGNELSDPNEKLGHILIELNQHRWIANKFLKLFVLETSLILLQKKQQKSQGSFTLMEGLVYEQYMPEAISSPYFKKLYIFLKMKNLYLLSI